jgi:ABC-2 type transport system ATP-binding protein
VIEIRNFSKAFGDFVAVRQLSMSVAKGDIYGFIGPNGAGKSTTIRFLATLLKPTMGAGTVAGYDVVRQVLDVRQQIGFMPDAFGVFDGMKVWEFLDFFATAYGIRRDRRKRIIEDVLELVDLGGKRTSPVESLSRGMKQRLCLAKTLVHDPPVLILDEPASGLDPRARIEMKELLRELQRMGKTILISSHILSELADCCNKVGIIERGNLLAAGTISEILSGLRDFRRFHLRALSSLVDAERVLSRFPFVRGLRTVHANDSVQVLEVDLDGPDEDVVTMTEALVGGGVKMVSFREVDPNLEDLFMTVTKGEVQ